MPTKPLTQRTLFSMGREKLEKRILSFYTDSQDADSAIQYVVAVLVRQSLCINNFSLFCQDLIKEILLAAEPTEVLRKCCPLFRAFFESDREWEQVIERLYKNTKEFHRYNNRLSDCKKYLFVKTTPAEDLAGQQYKLISTFLDAVGKAHTWTLREADPHSSAMKLAAVLELLSSLTIFQKDDVRRFVQLENSEIVNCTRYVLIRKGEIVAESTQISASQNEGKATAEAQENLHSLLAESDFSTMSEETKLELVKMLLPKGILLPDARMEELKTQVSEEDPVTEQASGHKMPIAAPQERVSSDGKEAPAPTVVGNSAAETSSQAVYKKPKSEKQKIQKKKEELLKNKGKSSSAKGKNRARKNR